MPDSQNTVIRNALDLYKNTDTIAWRYFRDGIEIYPLYSDESGCSAALLKYEAGTHVPAHEHVGYEHILILHGDQSDGQQQFTQGDLVISPPGTSHAIQSSAGCIVLAIWAKPVKFI